MNLQDRLKELQDALQQSASQYQQVYGRVEEVKYLIQQEEQAKADALAAAEAAKEEVVE